MTVEPQLLPRTICREVRLHARYAALYPGFPAGIWVPADDAAAYVRELRALRGSASPRERLSGEHFEFRGADSSVAVRRQRRMTDRV